MHLTIRFLKLALGMLCRELLLAEQFSIPLSPEALSIPYFSQLLQPVSALTLRFKTIT